MENYLGEIRIVAFNFAPKDWSPCDGQSMTISSNTSLYSLLGTAFGGDGRTTFNLPDLRGRTPVGYGTSHLGTDYPMGQKGGLESVTLTQATTPAHTHYVKADTQNDGTKASPEDNFLAIAPNPIYGDTTSSPSSLNTVSIGSTGGGQSHNNIQPSLALMFIIAEDGMYPSRN